MQLRSEAYDHVPHRPGSPDGWARFPARAPPSTGRTAPVTKDARSLSSHAAAWAISSGSAARRSGVAATSRSCRSGVCRSQVWIISVTVCPRAMALTRTPGAVGECRRLGEAVDGPLHRGVGGQPGVAAQAADAGVVDDRPGPGGGADGGDLGGHRHPGAAEVHLVEVVEVGLRLVGERGGRGERRAVVEGRVEPAEQLDAAVDGGPHGLRVGQVAPDVVGGAAVGPDLLGDRLQLGLGAGREQDGWGG